METALSVIKLMPASRDQQTEFVKQLLSFVLDGEVNPLEMEVYLKSMDDVIKSVRKDVNFKGELLNEVDKYPGKTFDFRNAVITKASRSTYNYSEDTEWKDLDRKKKARETMLKGLSKPVVDPDTGEYINPPSKKQSEYLKIQYK